MITPFPLCREVNEETEDKAPIMMVTSIDSLPLLVVKQRFFRRMATTAWLSIG